MKRKNNKDKIIIKFNIHSTIQNLLKINLQEILKHCLMIIKKILYCIYKIKFNIKKILHYQDNIKLLPIISFRIKLFLKENKNL